MSLTLTGWKAALALLLTSIAVFGAIYLLGQADVGPIREWAHKPLSEMNISDVLIVGWLLAMFARG